MYAKKRTLLILALLALAVMLTACGRKTIVIKDYVTFEASGFNTAGKVKYKLEGEKLIEDNLDVFGLDTTDGFAALSVLSDLDKHLKGSLDREDGLSNGDQVTFHWNATDMEALEEKYDAAFELNDISYTVSGLQEAQQFDPFDYLQIEYDGIAPYAYIRLSAASTIPVSGILFTADRTSNLANGDTIVVTFGKENAADLCFQKGFIPTQTEKCFTVEGLSEYLQSLDALPEDASQKMDQHARDCLTAKYSYALELTKEFSDGKGDFSKVNFKAQNSTDGYWLVARKDADGEYYAIGHAENEADATVFVPNATTGKLNIYGCEDDTYVLTEIKTANGYTLLKDNITVVITAADDESRPCGIYATDVLGLVQNDPRYRTFEGYKELAHVLLTASATVDGKTVTMKEFNNSAKATVPFKVINTRGPELPKTGDNGLWMYGVIGAGLIAAAAAVMWLALRKRKSEN